MKNERDIFTTLKKEGLSKEERALLVSRLNEYRALKPAASREPERPFFLFPLFSFARPAPVFASLAALMLALGGVAQAAEGALPGDILYPIKTAVNEEVRVALAADTEAKAEAEAWRAERRLVEAQELAARVSLTEEKKKKLEERFAEHADSVEAQIAVISEEDPVLAANIATKFEASLLAHEAILAALDSGNATESRADAIRDSVKVKLRNITAARKVASRFATGDAPAALSATVSIEVGMEGVAPGIAMEQSEGPEERRAADRSTDDQAGSGERDEQKDKAAERAAERMEREADRALEKTERTFKKARESFTDEERFRIEDQFKNARERHGAGKKQLSEGRYRDAFESFQKVTLAMQTLDILLRTETGARGHTRVVEIEPIEINLEFEEIDLDIPTLSIPPEIKVDIDIDLGHSENDENSRGRPSD